MATKEALGINVLQTSAVFFSLVIVAGNSCRFTFSSLTSRNGTFQSPGYPSPYPNNIQCYYTFIGTQDVRINITFLDFHLENETDGGCPFDYVDYFAVDRDVKSWMGRLCGYNIPQLRLTSHEKVELEFITNYIDRFKGFHGVYEFVDESHQEWEPNSPECGPFLVTGEGGILTSPSYPSSFASNTNCTWRIRVDSDKKIVINFLALDLGWDATTCSETFVSIYNGFAVPGQDPDDQVCGQLSLQKAAGRKEFTSRSYRVTIRFQGGTRTQTNQEKFRLVWTAVKLPTDGDGAPCSEFKCKGGEDCVGGSVLCVRYPQYCISSSLRCNGIPNCGSYDRSDEEACLMQLIIMVLVITGPLVFIILITCIIYKYCRARKQRKMKEAQNPDVTNTVTHSKRKRKKDKSKDVQLEQLDSSPVSKRHSLVYANTGQPSITYSPSYCSRYKGLESVVPGHYENPYDVRKSYSPPRLINSATAKSYGTQSSPLYAPMPRVSPAHLRRSASLKEQRTTSVSATV